MNVLCLGSEVVGGELAAELVRSFLEATFRRRGALRAAAPRRSKRWRREMSESRLHRLSELGQSVWLDFVSRDLLESGGLARMVEEDAVVGRDLQPDDLPGGDRQRRRLRRAAARVPAGARRCRRRSSFRLAVSGHQGGVRRPAAGLGRGQRQGRLRVHRGRPDPRLRPRRDDRGGDPPLGAGRPAQPAREDPGDGARPRGDRGVHLARRLDQHHAHLLAAAPPRSHGGVPARPRALPRGRRRCRRGIASVASFFVSRVDTEADKRLDAIGSDEALALRGKLAIANAKLAYRNYLDVFEGSRWAALAARGATPQRCLWASTSTKNPDYRDVLYVENLIGPDTVNTMPRETIEAFQDHGEVARTLDVGLDEAERVLRRPRARRRRLRRRDPRAGGGGRAEVLRLVRAAAGRRALEAGRARGRVGRRRAG